MSLNEKIPYLTNFLDEWVGNNYKIDFDQKLSLIISEIITEEVRDGQ